METAQSDKTSQRLEEDGKMHIYISFYKKTYF